MTFGLLIDWVSSSYHQEIWMGVQSFCKDRGVNLLTIVTGRPGSPFRWEQMRNQLLEFIDSRRFDGFLFMTATLGSNLGDAEFHNLLERAAPAPVISLGARIDGVTSVVTDNRTGFLQLLRHLYDDHGHRRFAYAGGPEANDDARERKALFLEFLTERGLVCESGRFLEGEFGAAWGKQAVERLIPGSNPDFDVLVCANDDTAIGALEALNAKGLQVSRDLAVTGFDDVLTADLAALTTVRQNLGRLGTRAAELLYQAVGGADLEPLVTMESQLTLRQSCGCLSPAAQASLVVPRAESVLSFSEIVGQDRVRLDAELGQQGLPAAEVRTLGDDFLRAWERQDSRIFLHGIQQFLSRMTPGLTPDHLHYPLSILRRWVLQATEPADRRAFAEAAIHQARILLTETIHVQTVRKETHQTRTGDLLSDLNARLIYARSFDEQAAIILEVFTKLGIEAFRLSLYNDLDRPMKSARLVLTEAGLTPEVTYDPKELFAPGWEPAAPWSFVAEALFDRNAPLGFFLLQPQGEAELLGVFDQLCERVGRGVETVRRIQDLEDQVARRTKELEAALASLEANNRKLKDLALRDELTALYNRRGFHMLSEHVMTAHRRNGRPLVLFFADLDGLKLVNDTWGHDAGDEAIRISARLLTETFRADDVVARLGGDEFAVLAPECTPAAAPDLANRVSTAVDQQGKGRFGLSVGWVAIDPRAPLCLGDWMREADKDLYREKVSRKTVLMKGEPRLR